MRRFPRHQLTIFLWGGVRRLSSLIFAEIIDTFAALFCGFFRDGLGTLRNDLLEFGGLSFCGFIV